MANLKLKNPSGGSLNLVSADGGSDLTVTFPAGTGTAVVNGVNGSIVSGTAVDSTSGTSIDFTSIPSWVKRVTVMWNGLSTNGSSSYQIQLGAGSVTTSGYVSSSGYYGTSQAAGTATTGFATHGWNSSSNLFNGVFTFNLIGSNTWLCVGSFVPEGQPYQSGVSGKISLGGTLDRVRITTVNGTDTFDAGSINILYE